MRSKSAPIEDRKRAAALSRIFSASVYRELALKGRSPLFRRLALECSLFDETYNQSVSDLFEKAFKILRKGAFRSEHVYKSALTHKFLLGIHNLKTASLISEFRVGGSKADIVVINGTSTVYEIKSERDKLDRLNQQIADYSRAFSRINVISAEKHICSIVDMVPSRVGILCLTDRHQISTVREAKDDIRALSQLSVLDSVSLTEACSILTYLDIGVPDVPNTELYSALSGIFKEIPQDKVHEAMIFVLRGSRSALHMSDFLNEIPESLKSTALLTPIRKKDRTRLINGLQAPAKNAMEWI